MEEKPRITKENMIRLPIGSLLPVKCNTASELDAAYQNACYIRRTSPRDDGGVYKISRSSKTMTVTVKVEKGEAI